MGNIGGTSLKRGKLGNRSKTKPADTTRSSDPEPVGLDWVETGAASVYRCGDDRRANAFDESG
jgi:hypothetical protein